MRFGTGKNSNFVLSIYDKGLQLKQVSRLKNLPAGKYTRIEFRLLDEKIAEHFGGNTRQHVTHQKMVDLFFPLLYRLDPDNDGYLTNLPGKKPGLLAVALLAQPPLPGGEDVADWYLRVNGGTRAAKDLIRDAQQLVMRHRGMTLKQLVPEDSPYIDLGGETA